MKWTKCSGCGSGCPWTWPPGVRNDRGRIAGGPQTARRYVGAAQAAGLRTDGFEVLDDGLVGTVIAAVRPARPNGHGSAWDRLLGFEDQIAAWVAGDGTIRH